MDPVKRVSTVTMDTVTVECAYAKLVNTPAHSVISSGARASAPTTESATRTLMVIANVMMAGAGLHAKNHLAQTTATTTVFALLTASVSVTWVSLVTVVRPVCAPTIALDVEPVSMVSVNVLRDTVESIAVAEIAPTIAASMDDASTGPVDASQASVEKIAPPRIAPTRAHTMDSVKRVRAVVIPDTPVTTAPSASAPTTARTTVCVRISHANATLGTPASIVVF